MTAHIYDYDATFSVEGSLPFPLDLLRVFACVPATTPDAHRMMRTLLGPEYETVRIALRRLLWDGSFVPVDPSVFARHGWTVLETR
jgi:hypothetical protein